MSGFVSPINPPSSQSTVRPRSRSVVAGGASVLDRLADLCMATCLLVVPLTMAGIRETGIAIFVGCSLIGGLAWAIRQIQWPESVSHASGAEIIVVLSVCLVGLQLLRLPEHLLRMLAPFASTYLSGWGTDSARLFTTGSWDRISLTPELTRSGFVLLMAYSIFFLTTLQQLRSTADIDRLLRIVAVSVTLMALVGIGQLFLGNGQFLWMFDHPTRDTSWPAKGTFTNQNHFAHFLALGIGPLTWIWQTGQTPEKRRGRTRTKRQSWSRWSPEKLAVPAIAIVTLAAVLSFSRGGIAALLIALTVAFSVFTSQLKSLLKVFVPVAAFAVLGVVAFGTDALEAKWQTITQSSSLEELSKGRFALWSALAAAIPHFWRTGSGVGSHAEVYPTWLSEQFHVRFSHAESGYLQILIETGLPGLLLTFAAIALCSYWFMRLRQQPDRHVAQRATIIFAGLLASILHSTVDFMWYIPGCMIVTLTLVACLCRCCQLSCETHARHSVVVEPTDSRWPAILAWTLVLIMVPLSKLSAEVAYRDAASAQDWMQFQELAAESSQQTSFEAVDILDEQLDQIILHLEACVQTNPGDGRATARLAAMYLRRFERNQKQADNPLSVREIKNTVEMAGFESKRDIATWLRRAFGDGSVDLYRALLMARRAVHLQPLKGDLYLLMSQLGFLTQQPAETEAALINQAIRLRPHDAGVLFVAGVSLIEKGDLDGACEFFRKAFNADQAIQPMIIKNLATHFSAHEFIDRIRPNHRGLWLLFKEYGRLQKPEMQAAVAEYYQVGFQSLADGAADDQRFWHRSYEIFSWLKHSDRAVECLRTAVDLDPTNYALRRSFAVELHSHQQYAACLRQLKWCRLRNSDDALIARMWQDLTVKNRTEVSHEKR